MLAPDKCLKQIKKNWPVDASRWKFCGYVMIDNTNSVHSLRSSLEIPGGAKPAHGGYRSAFPLVSLFFDSPPESGFLPLASLYIFSKSSSVTSIKESISPSA